MNLNVVRTIAQRHLAETRAHLAHIESLEPQSPQVAMPLEAKVLNGLYYVQLYSALERTVNEAVQRSFSCINSTGLLNNHINLSFCTVSLFAELMSIRDSGPLNFITKSTNLFREQSASTQAAIKDTCLAKFLQNIWMKTFDELFDALGIQRLQIDPRVRTTVDEITDNRNKIAHGRENASVVGERHRSTVLRDKTNQIEGLLYSVIDALEQFCNHKVFIKPEVRDQYSI